MAKDSYRKMANKNLPNNSEATGMSKIKEEDEARTQGDIDCEINSGFSNYLRSNEGSLLVNTRLWMNLLIYINYIYLTLPVFFSLNPVNLFFSSIESGDPNPLPILRLLWRDLSIGIFGFATRPLPIHYTQYWYFENTKWHTKQSNTCSEVTQLPYLVLGDSICQIDILRECTSIFDALSLCHSVVCIQN